MPDLHPIGTFNDVKITDHGFDESSEKKTPFFWAKFETEHGVITGRFYLSDKSVEHTIKKIGNMGFGGKSLSELGDGTALRDSICQITVEHEEYDSTWRARVGFVNLNNAVMGPTHNEVAVANVKQFDAMWRAHKKADPEVVPF